MHNKMPEPLGDCLQCKRLTDGAKECAERSGESHVLKTGHSMRLV